MTAIPPFSPHAETQLTPVAPSAHDSSLPTNGLDTHNEEEEPSTIKCICGYQDDDGNTVFCEKCQTWQHILCFYGVIPNEDVPDIHECNDCSPRWVDARHAKEKQERHRQLREVDNAGDRKNKKTASKSHKKKTKDQPTTNTLVNGWTNDPLLNDRKSGSPRDFPPAKRHKTTHKPSASVSSISNVPSLAAPKKRSSSAYVNGQSPTKSPPTPQSNVYPNDYFAPEFLQLYRGDDVRDIDENIHSDVNLANDMHNWYIDKDQLAKVTDGMKKDQIFETSPNMEELEAGAPKIQKCSREDESINSGGIHPIWQWLTVEDFVESGHYVGELRGELQRQKAYEEDPTNRWNLLRHPEPFVFHAPHLPIVIDARRHGSQMRHVTRSCDPNLTLRTIIDPYSYRFCFVALKDIEPGDELTVGWSMDNETARSLHAETVNGNIAEKGIQSSDSLCQWVEGVLANFGGCACKRPPSECLLERAHRRNGQFSGIENMARRGPKSKKTKKQQISPISTGRATNSRAGSEALLRGIIDADEDNADTRSVSGSSQSKPGSRDGTPMTAHSTSEGNSMTLREARKLQQIERQFERAEHQEQQGQKRKKRNSAGSTLNTPSVTTPNQVDNSEPSPPIHRSAVLARKPSRRPVIQRPKARPIYADSSTQTDQSASDETSKPMMPFVYISPARRLLSTARKERLARETAARTSAMAVSTPTSPASAVSSSSSKASSMANDFKSSTTSAAPELSSHEDVDMKDAEDDTVVPSVPAGHQDPVKTESAEMQAPNSHPPIQPPAPPWNGTSPHHSERSPVPQSPQHSADVQVDLPPNSDLTKEAVLNTPLTETPARMISSTLSQSPPTLVIPQISSPTITNAVAPSPMRKKLSLSDYTRRKAKDHAATNVPGKPDVPSSQFDSVNGSTEHGTPEPVKDVLMKDASSPVSPVVPVADMGPPPAPASHPLPPLFNETS